MTDLLTQAEEFLRKNGEPLLADAVNSLLQRVDSLALQLADAMEIAREIGADVQSLLGGDAPEDQRP